MTRPGFLAILGITLLAAHLSMPIIACAQSPVPEARGKTIDRETFSLTLPSTWIEDTKSDDYDANALVTFERPDESCLVMLIIGKKTAGADASAFLEAQREAFEKQLAGAVPAPLTTWEGHAVRGYELKGKAQGVMAARARLVELDSKAHAGVLVEFAAMSDMRLCGPEFASLGKSFRLK